MFVDEELDATAVASHDNDVAGRPDLNPVAVEFHLADLVVE